ncbi:unnamed protein product [Dracunculus medinensis]|uniref:Uncharacterized protein n=1 Tax=Dracunculus medinensis TaxID=318479 RepID=A0A0N4U4P3_DRAME|nr:unnamed protein product [Dracunculus medinensis]
MPIQESNSNAPVVSNSNVPVVFSISTPPDPADSSETERSSRASADFTDEASRELLVCDCLPIFLWISFGKQ